jgi:GDP-L-fucose synthase
MTKLLILGSNGLLGKNAVSYFSGNNDLELFTSNRSQLDLRNQTLVNQYFKKIKPDIVLLSAANVGGIGLNLEKPSDLLLDNLEISTNVIRASFANNVSKLINFGSSCMYPVNSIQPMDTDLLLTGPTEKTSEAYASYKLATWKMIDAVRTQSQKNWITVIPATIYGPHDNFSLQKGHVISSLIRKFHDAKICSDTEVTLWGDGSPLREFIYVDDLLSAIDFILTNNIDENVFNIGSGIEISIKELAKMISSIVGFEGETKWDYTKPNGSPRKLLNSSYVRNFGWKPKVALSDGLGSTYRWFTDPKSQVRL